LENVLKPRVPVSAFVICKNEERHIRECLESLNFCDEVVLIDSRSTDATTEIARSLGARIIVRDWPGYKEQKAFGLISCVNEWVINIDADERIGDSLREEIITILENEYANPQASKINGYYINRVVFFLGKWWRRGGWYPEFRLRFFRKSATSWGGTDPHEKAIVAGRTERLNGEILHYTYQNISDQFRRLDGYSEISARHMNQDGKKADVFQLCLNPLSRFIKFYFFKGGYREGTAGFIVAITESYYTFMKYAKLWEINHAVPPKVTAVSQSAEKPSNLARVNETQNG